MIKCLYGKFEIKSHWWIFGLGNYYCYNTQFMEDGYLWHCVAGNMYIRWGKY